MSEKPTRSRRAVPAVAFVLTLLAPIAAALPSGGAAPSAPAPVPGPRLFVYRVATPTPDDVQRLLRGGWDVLEAKGDGFLLVQGEEDLPLRLALAGFSSELDHEVDRSGLDGLFTFYGGYRTAVEHEQHLAQVAAAHPELAVLVDYGDSWRRQQRLPNGHDLLALCLTKLEAGDCTLSPAAPKPRFFLMANVHAREITTSELAWRFVDDLVARYGVDADVTALLDHTEVWVAPMTNPDGHEIVESGGNNPVSQRKNANNSLGGCTVPNQGIDLNRNADFYWGTSGSSTSPCASTYQGTVPASEPEVTALQGLMALLFADRKGPNLSDPVPPDATGTMVTLHSASELVLWPYGHAYVTAPNDAELKSLAFRMSYFDGYEAVQSVDLYPASGATDDWAYGVLGVAGYTIEVGPSYGTCGGFTPAYSCVDSTFWPGNRGALYYAAKAARAPYVTPLGPSVVSVTATPDHGAAGTAVTVTAVVDDGVYGTVGTGRPGIQNVTAAELTVDTPPWEGGAALPMSAQDGIFNTARETATVTLATAGLLPGRHLLFVRGRDASGSWGATTSQWVTIDAPSGALFHTVAPCRAVDTRSSPGPLAGPALAGDGAERSFTLAGACGIPAGAVAAAANVTATEATAAGDLRLFPAGGPAPLSSVVNFAAGRTRANNAVLGLSTGGAVTVKADVPAGSVHLVLDVVGYFQ